MDKPSTSGMNSFASASTSPSKIPARAYKRKLDICTVEAKAKQRILTPEQHEPIVEITEDEMYPEEIVEETPVPQYNHVQDIRTFFERFQQYHMKMVALNKSLYTCLGLHEDYARIEKQLAGFLGELHYYREKEEALNTYNAQP